MITLPHQFKALRKGDKNPLFICGSGLSWGLIDSVNHLIAKCPQASLDLNCTALPKTTANEKDYLYYWAEDTEKQLVAKNAPFPKLDIARALGILAASWLAEADHKLPLYAGEIRHRVIARLAREKRFSSLWTLNWDCLLEQAFECVGFSLDAPNGITPWPIKYSTYVTKEDGLGTTDNNTICIFKPNGCARALKRASELLRRSVTTEIPRLVNRFLITQNELTDRNNERHTDTTGKSIFIRFSAALYEQNLITVGWSISEKIFTDVIEEARAGDPTNGSEEALSIIDPNFSAGHAAVVLSYGLTQDKAHFSVPQTSFTTDQLFLWIQALYALDCLNHENAAPALKTIQNELISNPLSQNYVINWVDRFLPFWTLLCARSGLQKFTKSRLLVRPEDINIEISDYHIPWGLDQSPRYDLLSAERILLALQGNAQNWDLEYLPGFLRSADGELIIIPVPVWDIDEEQNYLRELIAPIGRRLSTEIGFVGRIGILPIHHNDQALMKNEVIEELRAMIATLLKGPLGNNPQNISIINIEDIG